MSPTALLTLLSIIFFVSSRVLYIDMFSLGGMPGTTPSFLLSRGPYRQLETEGAFKGGWTLRYVFFP